MAKGRHEHATITDESTLSIEFLPVRIRQPPFSPFDGLDMGFPHTLQRFTMYFKPISSAQTWCIGTWESKIGRSGLETLAVAVALYNVEIRPKLPLLVVVQHI